MTITEIERNAVYKTIYCRRDTRSEFKPDPLPDDILMRILHAAHHAPSVGFMQPWDFIVVKDKDVKKRVKEGFEVAHKKAGDMFSGKRREMYTSFKLEGIMEAPVGICVTCDRTRTGNVVLGRTANPEMDLYSSVCAVQTLWLAARAENVGVGWVSIIHHDALRLALGIPDRIVPIAYLCVGYVTHFNEQPDLEKAGWISRMPIHDLIHYDQWDNRTLEDGDPQNG